MKTNRMKRLLRPLFVASLILASVDAQPNAPGEQHRFGTRLNQIVDRSENAPTNNFQLELSIAREGKTAKYRVTLNGGQVSTEFVDKIAKTKGDMLMISLQASLNPFEGGAEASIFLGRPLAWKSKVQDKAGEEKEITNIKSIGLTTKVALWFGKPVVIYDDEDEKITIKLAQL
jgi:hypothetical protein